MRTHSGSAQRQRPARVECAAQRSTYTRALSRPCSESETLPPPLRPSSQVALCEVVRDVAGWLVSTAASRLTRTDGYWEVSRTNRRTISRRITLLRQDPDVGWIAKWQPAKIGTSPTMISRQPFFKDSLMVWIVMLCVKCHHKQVFFPVLLQDGRNLHTAWIMPLDAGGTFWTRYCVMAWSPHELTDVVMCCTQPKHVSHIGTKRTLHNGTGLIKSHVNRACDQKTMQHLRKRWIPMQEAQVQENP